MMARCHVPGGVAVACISVGGVKWLMKSSETMDNLLTPVLDKAGRIIFPEELHPVFAGLIVMTGILCFLFGTLLPDVDNPKSVLGRHFYVPFGHRTFMHSVWPALIFAGLGCYKIFLRPLLFLAAGYLAHLICDKPSVKGVRLFWPMKFGPHWCKAYTTGEMSEYVFLGFLLAGAVICTFGGFVF